MLVIDFSSELTKGTFGRQARTSGNGEKAMLVHSHGNESKAGEKANTQKAVGHA